MLLEIVCIITQWTQKYHIICSHTNSWYYFNIVLRWNDETVSKNTYSGSISLLKRLKTYIRKYKKRVLRPPLNGYGA